jgi:glycosyltransferase involved in cell wall biosynthesis
VKGSLQNVSIIVPCYNEKGDIETCVQSILAQEAPPGGFEVLVADGMSDDGTRDILARLAQTEPRLRIIDNPGRITSIGLNAAIRSSRGEIIVRMDVHTMYAPDYVRQCVAALQETGADNVGGPWVAEGKGAVGQAIAAVFQSPFAFGGARGHDPTYAGEVDTVYLGCWRRGVFDQFGLFDEELVRNQDDEFNLRLTRAGGKIWQSPRIKSWYRPRASLRTLFSQYMQYGYWKVRVIQKHKVPASVRHLVPGCFVFILSLLAIVAPWWPLAFWIGLSLAGIYVIGNIMASFLTIARCGWRLLPLLPVVFACYHFGYGYGFIHGVLDIAILRRRPHNIYTKLTRISVNESS